MRQAGLRHSAFALRARPSGTSPLFRTNLRSLRELRLASHVGLSAVASAKADWQALRRLVSAEARSAKVDKSAAPRQSTDRKNRKVRRSILANTADFQLAQHLL